MFIVSDFWFDVLNPVKRAWEVKQLRPWLALPLVYLILFVMMALYPLMILVDWIDTDEAIH